jgi:catechol 2,3-dioxygenase
MPIPASEVPIRTLGLGEVVLRVADLDRSIEFYRDVLGFELIRILHDAIAFMRVAPGVAGHTQIIGLFRRDWPASRDGKRWEGCSPALSSLHHFAFEIPRQDYERILDYVSQMGLKPNTAIHPWIGWRSIYVSDPDDHTVEFVCYDESVLEG